MLGHSFSPTKCPETAQSVPTFVPTFLGGPFRSRVKGIFKRVFCRHPISPICLHSRAKRPCPNIVGTLLGGVGTTCLGSRPAGFLPAGQIRDRAPPAGTASARPYRSFGLTPGIHRWTIIPKSKSVVAEQMAVYASLQALGAFRPCLGRQGDDLKPHRTHITRVDRSVAQFLV